MILCGVVAVISGGVLLVFRKRLPSLMKKQLLLVAVAAVVGLLAGVAEQDGSGNEILQRNPAGEGDYQEEYILNVKGLLEDYIYAVEVPEQILTEGEKQEILSAAISELSEEFPGDNASINHICEKVVIRDSYQNGRVSADWTFSDYGVVDYEGNVVSENIPVEGILLSAQVELSCGDAACSEEFYFRVFPTEQTPQEALLGALQDDLEKQKADAAVKELKLPEQLLGYRLTWSPKEEYSSEKILILGVVLSVGVFFVLREKAQKKAKERQQKLILEYPDMLSKLALLLGAGMTMSGAWKRIATSYENKRQNNAVSEMPLYEEMLITYHEMEGGVSEERAYERFAERCGERRFRKLASILTQNLRKGTRGLAALLENEVEDAFEERKSMARKYGEEAGTKLLLPMIMMLGIVMAILIIPAFLSFQI